MNGVDDHDALPESIGRRALRFDPDERVPRLDATALAAAAERRTALEQLLRAVRGLALLGIGLGVEAVVALAAFAWLADVDPSGLLGAALSVFAVIAEWVAPLASFATGPAVATATLAALLFATVYERAAGREPISVRSS